MAVSNYERVGKALELLRAGLAPYVERELVNNMKTSSEKLGPTLLQNDYINSKKQSNQWDVSVLLTIMWDYWNQVFRGTLGHSERNLVSELRIARNNWAHQQAFSFDDTYRALDSAERLLNSVSAVSEAQEVAKSKAEILRVRHEEQSRGERRKVSLATVESQGTIALPPWREIVSPHEDVAKNSYQNAEFAADLWQVYLGQGSSEYQDPEEFFKRTYLTQSLKGLLKGAMQRIAGTGGDPVIQLQTNFGGGKTHSMLALYHLFASAEPAKLLGVDEILSESGLEKLPLVKRVILVGTKISPSSPSVKADGTKVHTLWGELAYQLGGKAAYDVIANDDLKGTSPGDAIRVLMNTYGPCLILIDEWVAYARQLHDDFDLAGGNFDTQFTFAQALTESASAADHCLLVVSLPASDTSGYSSSNAEDIEVGGERGRTALERLRNAVGRVEATWRPASAEESFEIVRRRLFNPLSSREQFVARDKVARAFFDLYTANPDEFPRECRQPDYEKSLRDAYPIHPEVFERLYSDWSTLAKFQRTRGVLRLMAAVIHSLWRSGNTSSLIMPAHIPMDDDQVRSELTRYLPDNWTPVIDKDVDGTNSLPVRLDGQNSELGKYLACRRVTRTVYLGSAPTANAANKGLDIRRVKLGCVMPGEPPGKFSDALRRLTTAATYLYSDDTRYWFDTQPTVTKLVEDKAELLRNNSERVVKELRKRLKLQIDASTDFAAYHLMPSFGGDVPDDVSTRIVILGPEYCYVRDPTQKSPAEKFALELLESRGNAQRQYRNTVVFLVPDQTRLVELDSAIRYYLAWEDVLVEKDALNLTPFQVRQAENQKVTADQRAAGQLPETYQWLLVPTQNTPTEAVKLASYRLSANDSLISRAFKKLRSDELLFVSMGGTRLRMALDRIPLWPENSVSIAKLVEYFASYNYLPRLTSPSVLYRAIEDGVKLLTWQHETFAFAEGYDQSLGRYQGLVAGERIDLVDGSHGLLVKPTVAIEQMTKDRTAVEKQREATDGLPALPDFDDVRTPHRPEKIPKLIRRYHATVELDPEKASEVSRIYNEVIVHLTTAALTGVRVNVSLEIEAYDEHGFSDQVIRIVSENATALKFKNQGFDEN